MAGLPCRPALPWGVSGATPDEIEKKQRSFQPIVGIELPLVMVLVPQPGFFDNIRTVIATSLRDLGSDLYVGIEVFPLAAGARGGAFPRLFLALHYNASGALSTALGLLK